MVAAKAVVAKDAATSATREIQIANLILLEPYVTA